jgi:AraC family transcriptional regulator
MILTQFPDLDWLKKQTDERFATGSILPPRLRGKGWPNVVLNVKSRSTIRNDIRGPFSIFFNFSGESRVQAGKKNVKLKEDVFFLSNHDQYYTLEVEKNSAVETCNVHFAEYFIEEAFNALKGSPENSLDNHFQPAGHMELENQLYPSSPEFKDLLTSISRIDAASPGLLEERLFQLAQIILSGQKELAGRQKQLPAVKGSTQKEIMRRLSFATDYMYSNYDNTVDLETLADESQLSKFHFLRLFTHAFGKTPHQYVTSIRIERAKTLLVTTHADVKSTAREVGFVNASSFSRMFFGQVGVYPSQFIHESR